MPDVVTVDGANHALHRRAHRRLTLGLERRVQRYHEGHKGPSQRTSGRRMTDLIIPSLEEQLSHGSMSPVPTAVLAAVRDARTNGPSAEAPFPATAERTPPAPPTSLPNARWLRLSLIAGIVLLGVGVGGVAGWFVHGAGTSDAAMSPPAGTNDQTALPKTVVVQNKYATGSSSLLEDPITAYLSTSPEPYCSRRGCKVDGTD
ncbi:MAG: hypothetical protein ACRD0H_29800, partial [Actinomycetes bacterium]